VNRFLAAGVVLCNVTSPQTAPQVPPALPSHTEKTPFPLPEHQEIGNPLDAELPGKGDDEGENDYRQGGADTISLPLFIADLE
jgi:hypothetical protein